MLSPEEKRAQRKKKMAEASKRHYQRKRASMSEEELKAHRAKQNAASKLYYHSLSPEQKKATNKKQAARIQRRRENKRAKMSPEEREAERGKQSTYTAAYRLWQKKRKAEEESTEESCDYDIGVATTSSIQQARYHDQKRIMGVDNKPNACRAAVCVLCDRFIIGCESIHKLSVDSLRSQKKRISVKSYEDYHEVKLKKELVSQYQIDHEELEGLLLSPRAKQTKTKDGHVAFETCSSCYGAWQSEDNDNPPKYAISNGFAIGQVPTAVIDIHDPTKKITEEMSSLLAPVRPFAYIFAYTAGAHKAIRGHFSFFEVDLTHTGSVMNHFLKTGANPLVYVVLCGRMTPKQKQIVKDRARLDTQLTMKLLEWFVNESGHPGYDGVVPPSACPQPNIIADEDTPNNTDQEHDPHVEKEFAGASFHFTSAHEPRDDTGVYDSNQKFVKAMLDRTMPTLLVNGGNYADLRELRLEDVCPLQFPFGQGGPKVRRRTNISLETCCQHYCKLSLPQFMRGDFLLILNHIHNRQRSYRTAVVTCKSSLFGESLAEKMSKLTMKDLDRALFQKETRQRVSDTAGEYIKAVEASCQPVGYTALSSKQNRRKHFAMDNYFGGHSIFLTTTPCDERTIRVQVFAKAGTEVDLPKLGDWDNEGHMDECKASFELRKTTRSSYPGACSLVYQHLMQIVTECLIGWDPKTQSGREGVFGVPIAYSRTDEEQGRKTLHSHWQIWVKNFNRTRDALFHTDESKRRAARDALISYIDKVVCASYGTDFVVTHECGAEKEHDGPVTKRMHEILQEVEDKNTLRKAQHQDHCLDVKGKVLECKHCGKTFSPKECINMGVNHERQQSHTPIQDHANSDTGEASNTTVMRKEWLDHTVIRYPYDFDENGEPTEALKQQLRTPEAEKGGANKQLLLNRNLRRDVLHSVVDEHDYTHRGTCFKGGKAECRGHLPEMASEDSIIFDNDAIDAIKQQDDHRGVSDNTRDEDNIVMCYHLSGEVERKSQFAILPRRRNGGQFLNQHSVPISDVLACNTNVTLGDASHTFYTTLYKSKDTQAEDKMAYHRLHASLGRRLWRAQQLKQQQERERNESGAPSEGGCTPEQNDKDNDSDSDEQQACFIEGLGRVMTGVHALLSRDVVSATMAHLLISQGGERFTYSHKFEHIILQNVENILEEKDGTRFHLRRNWNEDTNEAIAWADSSANDYIHRPEKLGNVCLYEFTMSYKKIFKSFKQINDKTNPTTKNSYQFAEGHPGRKYCHLTRRAHPVIPIINMPVDLCDIKSLDVLNDNPTDSATLRCRERYAKTAMMLFYPFRRHEDLMEGDSYWQKFVDAGGTKEYDETTDDTNKSSAHFWKRGKMILENIETRRIAEKEMKRPKRKITYFTDTPKSTGKRKREGMDDDEEYDIDINDFFDKMNDEGMLHQMQASEPQPLAQTDLRSHEKIMKRAGVQERNAIKTHVDDNVSILATGKVSTSSNNKASTSNSKSKHSQPTSNIDQQFSVGAFDLQYNDVLTFIQGALLHGSNDASDKDTHMDGEESSSGATPMQQQRLNNVPNLHDVAKGKNSKYNLDDKQYIAYQIVCCTFLLQLVAEGDNYDTKLGEMLGASLEPLAERVQQTKDSVMKDLKAMGGREQLIMFLTGAAGCGKSTTMEAAQFFCHKFCTAIAAAFNDYTFYFTATTGSAAALFGGTTIHSAAHLNKRRINDEMRAVWRDDVRILIIDEISFFKASDIDRLDKQLKKLTGRYDMVYGGVSIVFSGDFHQLKPICAEDDVLYSGSPAASVWENTINCAIFLDNSHRFKDDPEFGKILARMRMGDDTREDRELINSRVVNATLTLPEQAPDACFACSTNKERNGVTASCFKLHIKETHPTIDDDNSLPPDHTLMIEASISTTVATEMETEKETENKKRTRRLRKRRKVSAAFHDTVITYLGDDDIKVTEFAASGAKIEPVLRTYPGCHHMCITNEDLDKGRGNGTLCKCLKVKLRRNGLERRWKNWDGKKLWTVSVDDVEWIEFEHYPAPSGTRARTFRLKPREFSATIKFPLTEDLSTTVGNAKVKQVPVNCNIATTGHKLQGMSKDVLIVNDWNYRCTNWVYVVLSRVRTLAGLYLMKPLDLERSFNVPQSLIRFEQRLKDNKERPILVILLGCENN